MNRQPLTRLFGPLVVVCLLVPVVAAQSKKNNADPETVFNTQSRIYHRASCSAARRCTKNCIVITLSEARKRGGRPCQICGGPATTSDQHEGQMTAMISALGYRR